MTVFKKEPVLFGAALTITVHGLCLLVGLDTTSATVVDGIALAWVTWLQRLLSTPTIKADARVDAAHQAGQDQATAQMAKFTALSTTVLDARVEEKAAPPKRPPAKQAPAKKAAARR